MTIKNIILWSLKIIAAVIMLQTLYFKFTADEMSVRLFSTLGMEPWGRISIGVMELVASILLLYPRTSSIGAVLGVGLMSGAIYFHLTKLGIYFDGDPILFIYAMIVFIACIIVAALQLKDLASLARKVLKMKHSQMA